MLVNSLAADEKYPVLNRDNLTIPIQMQLSLKQNTFSPFLASILKLAFWSLDWIFEYFETKDDPHPFFIFQLSDLENVVR